MTKRFFNTFREAGVLARSLATAGNTVVTLKRQGDGFVVETSEDEEPPKANPYRDAAGRIWEELEERDRLQSELPRDHGNEMRLREEAVRRSENIRRLSKTCYICSGSGRTPTSRECKACLGRGFL